MRFSLGNIAKFTAFVTIAWALNTTLFSQKLPKNMYFNPDSTRLITGGVKSNGLYDQENGIHLSGISATRFLGYTD